MDSIKKPQKYKLYYLYMIIELQNGAGRYDIFHTIAIDDWLVWGNQFFQAHTHHYMQFSSHRELASESICVCSNNLF
jgi:hypothetical protein